jgi:hypothetical protein
VSPQDLLATPAGFKRWLEQKPGAAVVGWPNTSGLCPIAMYLRDCGVDRALVSDSAIVIGAAYYELARWARRFVKRVDHEWHAIHADFALAMLEQGR